MSGQSVHKSTPKTVLKTGVHSTILIFVFASDLG